MPGGRPGLSVSRISGRISPNSVAMWLRMLRMRASSPVASSITTGTRLGANSMWISSTSSRSPSDFFDGALASGEAAAAASAASRSLACRASQAASARLAAPSRNGTNGRPGMKAKSAISTATVASAVG